MNRNWLANSFRYLYEVVVEADKPIFMFSMVILPFVAPLLPALITASNLQKYMGFPVEWTWIGVVAFELVAMLSQMASVSANMKLVDNPDNVALKSEAFRTGLSYGIYIATLIASNAILEYANKVSLVQVLVTACLTVGLSFSASLINATRIYNRDKDDKDEMLRREGVEERKRRWNIKHGVSTSESIMKLPKDFQKTFGSNSKIGRPSVHQERVFAFLDENYLQTGNIPSYTDVVTKLGLPPASASRLRKEWMEKKQNEN